MALYTIQITVSLLTKHHKKIYKSHARKLQKYAQTETNKTKS